MVPSLKPTRLTLGASGKWLIFRALEVLSEWRSRPEAGTQNTLPANYAGRALWVFVSTIGELNAIGPFLRSLCKQLVDLKLVLITDHEHYRAAYTAQYPDSIVYVTRGRSADASTLAGYLPPSLLIVGEIPGLLNDAPCRFSYAFRRIAKRHQARICLVNGWLYHYSASCRMDFIENWLFRKDFVRLFDLACVQTGRVRELMIEAGAAADRLLVTGNIKFDAMNVDWSLQRARSPRLLEALTSDERPIVVAGCVTSYEDQKQVLDAFIRLCEIRPRSFLVLAPRHPEIREHMLALETFLSERGVRGVFRTQVEDAPLDDGVQCLILDSIGELRDFYAIASVAYVGRNHNILEPLAFGKPTVVSEGWESTYPSYPVYQEMLAAGAVLQANDGGDVEALGDLLLSVVEASEGERADGDTVRDAVTKAKGASARCLSAVASLMAQS